MNAKHSTAFASLATVCVFAGCAAQSGLIEGPRPPRDLPEPTVVNRHVANFPPELVVTRIACLPQMVGSHEKLEVVATIADTSLGDAPPFFTRYDVTYTQQPTATNPSPLPQTVTGFALTSPLNTNPTRSGGVLPGNFSGVQTTEVALSFYSARSNPNGSQANIDPADSPFTVTVTANSGDANRNGVIAESSPRNNVRNCTCTFPSAVTCP